MKLFKSSKLFIRSSLPLKQKQIFFFKNTIKSSSFYSENKIEKNYFSTKVKNESVLSKEAKGDLNELRKIGYESLKGKTVDVEKAIRAFEEGVEANDVESIRTLAYIHYTDKYGVQNIDKAVELYKVGANNGDLVSLKKLGFIYAEGDEQPQNIEKAIEYLEKAVEKEDIEAVRQLAYVYEKYTQNMARARDLYESGANKEDTYCIRKLAGFYETGFGEDSEGRDEAMAKDMYLKAATLGDAKAMTRIGYYHLNGVLGFEADEEKARDYFNKAVIEGDVNALNYLFELENSKEEVEDKRRSKNKVKDTRYPTVKLTEEKKKPKISGNDPLFLRFFEKQIIN